LYDDGFVEINTPKIIAGASEGGADVFTTDYFGQTACLAQSPQLYKQMAISSDLKKVFEIGPVFRAEKSNTRRHLCEFTGLDMEMEIKSHYNEALLVVHNVFKNIFANLETKYKLEIDTIREQYPSSVVEMTDEPLVINWKDGIAMLREAGEEAGDFDDLTSAQEVVLGALVKEKFKSDFFILDQYPSNIRPFYTMLNPEDDRYSNSYDMFLRGQEICSGAQRCHDPAMLEAAIVKKGIDPTPLKFYIDCFRHGIAPHAGAGIGLDRVLFLYLGNKET
jgi:aspartyl/asparaginyl-tRNA synthetase